MFSVYRSTLSQALYAVRVAPHLWVFGFFAALFGNGGHYQIIVTTFSVLDSGSFSVYSGIASFFDSGSRNAIGVLLSQLAHFFAFSPAIALISLVTICFIIWAALVAHGAIIHAIAETKKTKKASFGKSFAVSRAYFWHILGATFAAKFTALFVFSIIAFPAVALLQYVTDAARAFGIVFFGVGIPLIIIFSFIVMYAVSYIVIDRLAWKDAYVAALRLFGSHWLVSIEMALSLFVITLAGGIGIASVVLLISAPFLLLASSVHAAGWLFGANAVLHFAQLFTMAVYFVLGSILAVYQYAAWTTLFLKIQDGSASSKLMRTLHAVRERHG